MTDYVINPDPRNTFVERVGIHGILIVDFPSDPINEFLLLG